MLVGTGMCIFLSNVSDSFLIMFSLLYFIYLITRQHYGNSWLCELCQLTN